jgi:hypothetical protein
MPFMFNKYVCCLLVFSSCCCVLGSTFHHLPPNSIKQHLTLACGSAPLLSNPKTPNIHLVYCKHCHLPSLRCCCPSAPQRQLHSCRVPAALHASADAIAAAVDQGQQVSLNRCSKGITSRSSSSRPSRGACEKWMWCSFGWYRQLFLQAT